MKTHKVVYNRRNSFGMVESKETQVLVNETMFKPPIYKISYSKPKKAFVNKKPHKIEAFVFDKCHGEYVMIVRF